MASLNSLVVTGATRLLNRLYCGDITVSGSSQFSNLSATALSVSGGTALGALTASGAVVLSDANNPVIIGGTASGTHLELTADGIYAKSASSSADLEINPDGGMVDISGVTASSGTLNASNIIGSSASLASVQSTNINVTNTLRAARFDLQTISQLGGALLICPTVKFPSMGTATLTVAKSSTALTIDVYDPSLTTSTIANVVWTSDSKVKASGTIGGIVTGTMDGTITSLNTTSHTIRIVVSGENWASVVAGSYTASQFSDFSIMLYSRAVGSYQYPAGIYINCDDSANGSPTMKMYNGQNANPRVFLGNLTGAGLSAVGGVIPTGYGLYSDNCYLSGTMVANSGTIGGFAISNGSIRTLDEDSTSSGAVALGSSNFERTLTINGSSVTLDNLRFAIAGNFGVTSEGYIYANGVNLSGSFNANSGTIGGFAIESNSIHTAGATASDTNPNNVWLSSGTFTRLIGGTSRSGLKFAIGGNFGVSNTGKLYASSGEIAGMTIGKGTFTYNTITGTGTEAQTVSTNYLASGTTRLLNETLTYNEDLDPFQGNGKVYVGTNGISLGDGFVVTPDGKIRIYGSGYNGISADAEDSFGTYGISIQSLAHIGSSTEYAEYTRSSTINSHRLSYSEQVTNINTTAGTSEYECMNTSMIDPNQIVMHTSFMEDGDLYDTHVALTAGSVGSLTITNNYLPEYNGTTAIYVGADPATRRMTIKVQTNTGSFASLSPSATQGVITVCNNDGCSGGLLSSISNNLGLWSNDHNNWIIYEDTNGYVHIPSGSNSNIHSITYNIGTSIGIQGYYTGVISAAGTNIYLTIPLCHPIVATRVTASAAFCVLRQEGNYIGGTSASDIPSFTVSSAVINPSGVKIVLSKTSGFGGRNNALVSVYIDSLTLTFA